MPPSTTRRSVRPALEVAGLDASAPAVSPVVEPVTDTERCPPVVNPSTATRRRRRTITRRANWKPVTRMKSPPAMIDTVSQILGVSSTSTPVAWNKVGAGSPNTTVHESVGGSPPSSGSLSDVSDISAVASSGSVGMTATNVSENADAGSQDPSPQPASSASSASERANGSPSRTAASSASARRFSPAERSIRPSRLQVVSANSRWRTSRTSEMAAGPTTSASTAPRRSGCSKALRTAN